LGFSAVEFACDPIGVAPLPWQRWLLIHALELGPGGGFRFRTVLIMVARQNGKTTIVEIKNLWKMLVLQVPLVLGTAQDLTTSEESWEKAVEICQALPELATEIARIDRTNGKKSLKLTNGSAWKVAAPTGGAGRGKSVDDANLDELREHHTWAAWGAVTKTTMARPNAQIFAYSNAGDDRSIVLNHLQKLGRAAAANPAAADPSLGHFEWSVPDDVACSCGRPEDLHAAECRLADRRLWAMANPALGYTIDEQTLASALTTDPDAVFRTECLCQHVPDMAPDWSVISERAWTAIVATPPALEEMAPVALAIDVTPERSHTSIGVAGQACGRLMVEVTEHRRGTGWVVPWFQQRLQLWKAQPWRRPVRVVIAKNSPAGSLIKPLEAAGIEVTTPSVADEAQACGAFVDAAAPPEDAAGEPTLWHLGQPVLDEAVRGAAKVDLGDGAWRWSRKNSLVVISPLVATTLAKWGYETRPAAEPAPATASVPPPGDAREMFRPRQRLHL
jgi:phage terminase large subunit-like protein